MTMCCKPLWSRTRLAWLLAVASHEQVQPSKKFFLNRASGRGEAGYKYVTRFWIELYQRCWRAMPAIGIERKLIERKGLRLP